MGDTVSANTNGIVSFRRNLHRREHLELEGAGVIGEALVLGEVSQICTLGLVII